MDKVEILKHCKLADGFELSEMEKLAAIGIPCDFSKGEAIIKEEDFDLDLYIIYEGWASVEIKRIDETAEMHRLRVIKNFGVIGEFSYIDHSRRSANVIAQDAVSCLRLRNEDLNQLIKDGYKTGYKLIRNIANLLCERMRSANFELRNNLLW